MERYRTLAKVRQLLRLEIVLRLWLFFITVTPLAPSSHILAIKTKITQTKRPVAKLLHAGTNEPIARRSGFVERDGEKKDRCCAVS